MNTFLKPPLRLVSRALPERTRYSLVRSSCKRLADQLYGRLTDQFLELLLRGMDLAFVFLPDYRRNIEGFRGTLNFQTRDGTVGVSAVFTDGDMKVLGQPSASCQVLVRYKDPRALWSFLVAGDQDILDSILNNTVDAEGNLTYIYRFGFLARDLRRRLSVA